ncbi:MAG: hypothetical protein V3R56_00450, partial [Xanthomonadales bacterium]
MKNLFILLTILLAGNAAQAQLQIEILSGTPSALPIAIVPFQWQDATQPPPTSMDEIISGDLYRSGLFEPMETADML